ncbi:MAG: SGNH/GDSL hydrolase family protein [Verrucomicrobia subdivision 3 bacterium]|nr:SGNH/GDSL hydrolase family protein [Limisphaerales bacterium]
MNRITKITDKLLNRLKLGAALGLAFGVVLAGSLAAEAKSTPFSRITVFGDSLSDIGNLHRLTEGFPPPPYVEGRFSNGELWIEYLAEDLGMDLLPEDNYAVGGATTGSVNVNGPVFGLNLPGLQDQIAAFLAARQPSGADPEALYVIWAGANDFFLALEGGVDPATMIAGGVSNTVRAVHLLWSAGAAHIMVVNVPDLGLTPSGLASGRSAAITQLAAAYNHLLGTALQNLAHADVQTIFVDAFATLQAMVTSPADFDFTNVTTSFLSTGGDPSEFLFWDMVHPTTRGHQVFGREALDRLVDHFSPSQGKAAPRPQANSLRGLVHARP